MALPKIIENIDNRVSAINTSGDTMKGALRVNEGLGQLNAYTWDDGATYLELYAKEDDNNKRTVLQLNSSPDENGNPAIRLLFRDEDLNVTGVSALYGQHNKPIASDVGALSLSGGTLTGPLTIHDNNYEKSTKFGVGSSDVYWYNSKSGKYVQNKDDGTFSYDGKQILDAGNYTNYTITKTGSGASGTWGINVSGNASTASKLATGRTLTIGNTGKTFDGSGNVSWSLSEIGAASSSHTHSYLSTGGGSMSGSISFSGSASAPKTPGLSFSSESDGANIFFQNESDGDPNGGLYFQISDDTSNANIFMSYKGWNETDPITFVPFCL